MSKNDQMLCEDISVAEAFVEYATVQSFMIDHILWENNELQIQNPYIDASGPDKIRQLWLVKIFCFYI